MRLAGPAALWLTGLSFVGGCASPGGPAGAQMRLGTASVAWDSWTNEAFARAKAEKRLILVDVVAEWCHWCHVMDKTTYADADVAALLDADFVAIRVDSDARPDVAERYREWGWPATAILTPDAQPVLELRGYQEAGDFAKLLRSTVEDFRAGRPIARKRAEKKAAVASDLDSVRAIVQSQLDGLYDAAEEGWGTRQKYPIAAPVEHSFFAAWLEDDAARRERALATLAKATKLIDPVWGGMYQYSTNSDWDHPHFEKIAVVQAGAMSNFAQAFAATGDRRWLDAAKAVKGWVKSFLTAPDGAFGSSQDADVGAHGDAAAWIDGHDYFVKDDAARRAIGIPRVDTNVYADRNGLLIQALCDLSKASRDADALAMARKAALRVAKSHAGPVAGFTHGEAASGETVPMLFLPDQVEMGRAFLALAEAGAEPAFLARADAVAQSLRDHFEDKAGGGFWAHTLDDRAAGVFAERRKPFADNARAARFLLRLFALSGEELWKQSAERALRALGDPAIIADEGRAVGDYLLALDEFAHPPLHLNVVGRPGTKETSALYAAALAVDCPNKAVKLSLPGDEYPDIGKSAVYVCSERTCSSPVTDPAKVDDAAHETLAFGK